MIKYISAEGYVFKFDKDTENIEYVKRIDWYMGRENYFIVEEDGEVNGENVHSGDVIMTILDGEVVFKVPDNVATIIKNKVEGINKRKVEKESIQHNISCECDCER